MAIITTSIRHYRPHPSLPPPIRHYRAGGNLDSHLHGNDGLMHGNDALCVIATPIRLYRAGGNLDSHLHGNDALVHGNDRLVHQNDGLFLCSDRLSSTPPARHIFMKLHKLRGKLHTLNLILNQLPRSRHAYY